MKTYHSQKEISQKRFLFLLEHFNQKASCIAKETGIAPATLSNWKHGRYCPKMDKIKQVAAYFDVSPNWLSGENVPMLPSNYEYNYTEENSTILLSNIDNNALHTSFCIPASSINCCKQLMEELSALLSSKTVTDTSNSMNAETKTALLSLLNTNIEMLLSIKKLLLIHI